MFSHGWDAPLPGLFWGFNLLHTNRSNLLSISLWCSAQLQCHRHRWVPAWAWGCPGKGFRSCSTTGGKRWAAGGVTWPLSEPGTGRQPAVVVLQLLRLCGENRGSDVKNRSCLRATGLAANLLRLLHRENISNQPKRRAHPSNYMAFLRSHVASWLILSSKGTCW